jgi:hypothetical protein
MVSTYRTLQHGSRTTRTSPGRKMRRSSSRFVLFTLKLCKKFHHDAVGYCIPFDCERFGFCPSFSGEHCYLENGYNVTWKSSSLKFEFLFWASGSLFHVLLTNLSWLVWYQQSAQRAGSVSLNAEEMSKAIPFLVRPEKLDGSMPGDMGFDPMRLWVGYFPFVACLTT